MPFTHGDDVHHQILYDREFESDESYQMESEEEDKLISSQIKTQNSVLDTMQRTISKMSKALKPQNKNKSNRAEFSFADTFVRGIRLKHDDLEGLQDSYEIVEETARDDRESGRRGSSLVGGNQSSNTNQTGHALS